MGDIVVLDLILEVFKHLSTFPFNLIQPPKDFVDLLQLGFDILSFFTTYIRTLVQIEQVARASIFAHTLEQRCRIVP